MNNTPIKFYWDCPVCNHKNEIQPGIDHVDAVKCEECKEWFGDENEDS